MSKRLNTLEFRLYSGFFRPIFVPVVFTTNDQLKLRKMASGRPRAVPSKIPLFRLKWIEEPATSFKISISNTCASSKEKSNRKWKYCECRSRYSKSYFTVTWATGQYSYYSNLLKTETFSLRVLLCL